MFEQTRQHYLKQMGVTLWYSRCELPGAAASPEFAFGANLDRDPSVGCGTPAEAQNTSIGRSEKESEVPKSAADILNSLSSAGEGDSGSSASIPPLSEDKTSQSSSSLRGELTSQSGLTETSVDTLPHETPASRESKPLSSVTRNQLEQYNVSTILNIDTLDLILWVGKKNWFLSDNDPEFPDLLKQKLLLNIASALGEDTEPEDVICFRWPFFGNQRLPGNDAESMFKLLLEWLGAQVESDGLNGFLMGEKALALFLQGKLSDVAGMEQELNVSDERGIRVTPTLSLNDLLRDPSNKRVVWQHLRSYCAK